MKKTLKYDFGLFLGVISWGLTFPLIKITLSAYADALPFMAMRYLSGGLTLWLIAVFLLKKKGRAYLKALFDRRTILGAILMALVGTCGMLAQTYGMYYTSASNSAFITGVYVLIIPLFSLFLFRIRLEKIPMIGLLICSVGLLLVCKVVAFTPSGIAFGFSSFNVGDFLTVLCAVLFALQVCLINHYTKTCDYMAVAVWQTTYIAAISVAAWLLFDRGGRLELFHPFMLPNLIICGVIACGITTLILAYAVQKTTPSRAAVILALEPVAGTAAAMLIPGTDGLRETLTIAQAVGSVIILGSIITVEYLGARKSQSEKEPI